MENLAPELSTQPWCCTWGWLKSIICLGPSAAARWFSAGTRGFDPWIDPTWTWLGACCRLASVYANLWDMMGKESFCSGRVSRYQTTSCDDIWEGSGFVCPCRCRAGVVPKSFSTDCSYTIPSAPQLDHLNWSWLHRIYERMKGCLRSFHRSCLTLLTSSHPGRMGSLQWLWAELGATRCRPGHVTTAWLLWVGLEKLCIQTHLMLKCLDE